MIARHLTRVSLTAALTTFAFTSSAWAKAGERSFSQTYPIASALCTSIANHTNHHRRLEKNAAQVKTACTILEEAFNKSHAAVVAAQSSFTTELAADKAAISSACPIPRTDRKLCRSTRRQERQTIHALRRQHLAAVHYYYTSVEAARRTFWATIRALPEGSSIPADEPIVPQPE